MRGVTIEGSRRHDGDHELALGLMTPRDYGLIKRLTGYMPADVPDGIGGYDLELVCAIAVVALRKNGRVAGDDGDTEARQVYDELIDMTPPNRVRLDLGEDEEAGEDDAGPPLTSSAESGDTPGPDSKTSSETSPTRPGHGGTPASGSLESGLLRSVN